MFRTSPRVKLLNVLRFTDESRTRPERTQYSKSDALIQLSYGRVNEMYQIVRHRG